MRHLKIIAYSFFLISVVCVRPLLAQGTSVQDTRVQDTIISDKLVIITHPCTIFDSQKVAQEGANRLIEQASKNEWPTVVLTGCETYVSESDKLIKYESNHGEFDFLFTSKEIYLAGGYLEWCLDNTLNRILEKFEEASKASESSLTYSIYMVADATYGREVPPETFLNLFGFLLKDDLDSLYKDDDALLYWVVGWLQPRYFFLHVPNFNISVSVYGKEIFQRRAHELPSHSLNIHFINTSDLK